MELVEWRSTGNFDCGSFILVPASRADIIRAKHTSISDQKKAASTYCVTCCPHASWGYLAKVLYHRGKAEKRAMKVFKAQLPKPKGIQ